MAAHFHDALFTPELVLISAGNVLARDFCIGRYAVTFDEFDHFCVQTGRPYPTTRTGAGDPIPSST